MDQHRAGCSLQEIFSVGNLLGNQPGWSWESGKCRLVVCLACTQWSAESWSFFPQYAIQTVFYSGLCDLWSADIILLGISHKPLGFPRWHSDKEPTANAGNARDAGLIPGLGRYPVVRNGNPLQYYCLGNSMDRRIWSVGSQKSWTRLSH